MPIKIKYFVSNFANFFTLLPQHNKQNVFFINDSRERSDRAPDFTVPIAPR